MLVSIGRALSVFTNGLHEAMFCGSPFIHSVMWEVDYCSPNAVILNAWRLRWEVLAHECPAWQNDVHRSLPRTLLWFPTNFVCRRFSSFF